MKGKYIEVQDARGSWWYVKEARPTKHGFDVLYGIPVSLLAKGGLGKLIVTKELKEYWDDNAIKHDGTLSDLPIPPTTRKRARKRYRMNYYHDIAEFWDDNLDDLKTLSAREFSAKHDMNVHKVREGRLKILGTRTRPNGWWKEPKVMEALLSKRTLKSVGTEFGISITQTARLRIAAKAWDAAQSQRCVAIDSCEAWTRNGSVEEGGSHASERLREAA